MRLAIETATDWKPGVPPTGDGNSTVVERTSPMSGAIEVVVSDARSAAAVKPGQFFQIAVGAPMTLLRRPYSAAWVDHASGHLGFIFNVVGRGSAWLATREPGDELDFIGPLGRGFDLDGERRVVCIAGGLGVAVFPGVVAALVARGRPVTVLAGARTAAQLMPAQRFAGAQIRLATDDGSAGHGGSVVELLPEVTRTDILACGPTPMLQALVASADRLHIPRASIQIALETPMGCGLGTCLGCPMPRQGGGYLLACQDGPCVRADLLDWDRIEDAFHG